MANYSKNTANNIEDIAAQHKSIASTAEASEKQTLINEVNHKLSYRVTPMEGL